MRLLLDTHTFLWFLSADAHLSVASLWEMAIKISLGKLSLTQPLETFIPDQLARAAIALLGISVDHTARVVGLPFHHRDPFDRLLIAQALVEGFSIVGADTAFDAYGVTRLW